jgi:hypothetical protein
MRMSFFPGWNQHDQVLFYEFGRNFRFYSSQLQYQSPDSDPLTLTRGDRLRAAYRAYRAYRKLLVFSIAFPT